MRTVAEKLVVCGVSPDVSEPFPDILTDTDLNHGPVIKDISPTGTFILGLPASALIALRRGDSALEILESGECELPTRPELRARRHALDASTEETVKGLVRVQADSRIPHDPAHQPSTQKLLKTLPSSIRNRAKSLDEPQPLLFRYKLPDRRYRIGDPDAFAALKEKNIEWYVTTGVLVEDCTGLRWNAGTYKYLLYWHVEGMPTPDGIDPGEKWLKIEPDCVRDWQKEKWEAEFGYAVMNVIDGPATPIVEEIDAMSEPMSPLNKTDISFSLFHIRSWFLFAEKTEESKIVLEEREENRTVGSR
ncbi:uncharacterized protein ALTATR162_LOCUS9450 [Alternaria atra]|uniref:Uncharacterized protein n=1 Tax=Alternaria atra TaxID=119953 RepID=A0A8J2N398_9PLEO|nr:uncharacterized protein ALTATR162_LOCUS9450 [Alternaria atra]CAG5180824.1 unnamed protein product [Alternaria atra]